MSNDTTSVRPASKWAGISVAVALFGLVVAWIGYATWTYVTGPNRAELREVMPDFRQGRVAVAPRVQAPVDGIRSRPNGSYIARAGDVAMVATKSRDGKSWNLAINYSRTDLADAEQNAALTARFRLVADAAFAKSLKVTPEQIAELKKIPYGINMVISDSDRAAIKSQWDAYLAAQDKAGPEKMIVDNLQQIGKNSMAATQADVAARVAQIKKILTAEQVAPFKQ